MKMKISKRLNELGKDFINIGVALKVVIVSIIFSITFCRVGVILSSINKDEMIDEFTNIMLVGMS